MRACLEGKAQLKLSRTVVLHPRCKCACLELASVVCLSVRTLHEGSLRLAMNSHGTRANSKIDDNRADGLSQLLLLERSECTSRCDDSCGAATLVAIHCSRRG